MIRRVSRICSELRLLGWNSARQRIIFELKRRLGLVALLRRPATFCVETYLKKQRLPAEPARYAEWWREVRRPFGFGPAKNATALLQRILTDEQTRRIEKRALERRSSCFLLFHHQKTTYNRESLWYQDPESRIEWPRKHSSRILLQLQKYGDIKLVWEIGRFAWVFDLVRAWLVDDDDRHVDLLFELIDDFAKQNPLYIGPHWTSEQEVAIRSLMLVFVQEVLADSPLLSARRLQRLHALMAMHGEYLAHDLDYAEIAIRNNHLINGAVGLYAIGACLSWHRSSDRWTDKAHAILLAAIAEQWYDDGGYVQPSNNYHRSAWHGMLWANRIAASRGDSSLTDAIRRRAAASLVLFMAQIEPNSGQLPNWGANDGALIGAWTSCDYSDYRPLVQSLAHLGGQPLPFETGPWDEEGFWFFGDEFVQAGRSAFSQPAQVCFPHQGVQVVRPDPGTFAFVRCGTMLSRYGQQADQLHVDLWKDGINIAVDAGSYNYNKSLAMHNWFRGTASHNTIILAERDQMIPHRKFKYLRWSKARSALCSVVGSDYSLVGVHDGYKRLEGAWVHARLLLHSSDTWVIVDRVWPTAQVEDRISIRLHWQLGPGQIDCDRASMSVTHDDKKSVFSFFCSRPGMRLSTTCGNEAAGEYDGWISRYYNSKDPVHAVNYYGDASAETLFVTTVGQASTNVDIFADRRVIQMGDVPLSVAPLYDQAHEMLGEL